MPSDEERLDELQADVTDVQKRLEELEIRADYTATREDVERAKNQGIVTAIAIAGLAVVVIGAIVAVANQ